VAGPIRILVAEADEALARIIERGLRAHGFEVAMVASPAAVVALARETSVRLVLLDQSELDSVIEQVRAARAGVPILVLTTADQPASAAEHQLEKPFAFEELIARIRALTRRANERRVTTLTAGHLRIDLLARCAWVGERVVDLPGREFALLEYFMRHPSRVLTRPAILSDVWGYHFDTSSNVVDVYVRYLRNKLDAPGTPSMIVSVRGAGYRFDPPATGSRTDLAIAEA
jgi:two-component system OmpR family response regulator